MEQIEKLLGAYAQGDWLRTAIVFVAVLVVTALVSRFVTNFLRHVFNREGERGYPAGSIFVNIARSAIWIAGLCVVLSSCFSVDVSAAIAALGVGGIAVSLGFQDTLSNIIGGLQVSILRIIAPGDTIEVGTAKGEVKDITWRHTTLVNAKGQEVVVPNSVINKTALVHTPANPDVVVPFVLERSDVALDEQANRIQEAAREAAQRVGTVQKAPVVAFSEVLENGYKGSVSIGMAAGADSVAVADVVVRAIADASRVKAGQS